MNAELVVKAIVEIGRADETGMPDALQQLASALNYRHAAIVEGEKPAAQWVPTRTVCKSPEFRRACRSVLHAICESPEPVRVIATTDEAELTESVRETETYAAAGVHLLCMCTDTRKTVLMLVSDDRGATLSEMEKRLLATVSTLVCKGLSGQALELADSDESRVRETLGIVSHDLRSPAGAILSYSEMLLAKAGGAMDPDHRDALARIRQNSLFILEMLTDLLESAQIDSGVVQLNLGSWDLKMPLEVALDRCRPAADAKNIALDLRMERPRIRARVDPQRVAQILDNLVTNAVKFSAPGSTVRVNVQVVEAMVEISVADSGQGIAADEVPRLFKKFSRTSTRATRGEKSTGLGLYIVNELTRLHGGTVRVETEPGRGSTFTFTLPLA